MSVYWVFLFASNIFEIKLNVVVRYDWKTHKIFQKQIWYTHEAVCKIGLPLKHYYKTFQSPLKHPEKQLEYLLSGWNGYKDNKVYIGHNLCDGLKGFNGDNSKCKLKTCPYCTKTCPHWTCFGSNYLKNGVWLAVTLDKNFNFSKVLLSPKFNYNSISIEVKKKILYYIVYPTLE